MKIRDLKSLRAETERLDYKMKVDQQKIITDIKLLRYDFLDAVWKGFTGLFKRDSGKKES